jgi:hypothetical protein
MITDFTFSPYTLEPIANNLWRLADNVNIRINMPAGKGYKYRIQSGFVTNLRSGSDLINPLIPRMGDEALTLSYILHDANYTWIASSHQDYHYMARDTADNLLIDMLAFCGMGKIRRSLIHTALSLFGGSAYKEENSGPYFKNGCYISFEVLC